MGYKLPVFLIVSIALSLPCFIINCANPVDEEPLRWKTVTEIPVTNRAFIIADEFDNLFDIDSMDVLFASKRYKDQQIAELEPDTVKGDTLEFSIFKRDTSNFEIHEKKLNEKLYTVALGAIAISNAPDLVQTIDIPAQVDDFNISLPVTFEKVYQIVFYDTVVNIMNVKLTNLSSASVSNVSLEIEGIGSGSAGFIAAGETETIQFPLSGRTLNNQAQITLSGVKASDDVMQMQIVSDINGLYASSLSVDDHLVSLKREYVNPYELTDTLDIDYVDIKDGFFIYEVTNHTGMELRVRGIHEHLWKASFAERNSFTSFEDLENTSHADSLDNYFGFITTGEVIAPPQQEQTFSQENISQSRLFAEWDSVLQKSVTRVRYIVSTGNPSGDTVTLRADNTLIFTIRSDFKYSKLSGTVVEPYETESDTEKVAIDIPWGETAADSLRGKFILQNVYSDVQLKTKMSQNSYIDSVWFDIEIFIPDSPEIKSTLFTQFINVENDSKHRRLIDITDVVNRYPDTIAIVTSMHIPRGTKMVSVNDMQVSDDDYDKYIGRMKIDVVADYRLNARFDWEVTGTVNMDLGSDKFPIYDALRYVSKLEKRQIDFGMKMINSSNLNINLFALVAPKHLIDTLDSMPTNEAFHMMIHQGEAEKRGLVNFLGHKGVQIPITSHDSMIINTVHWDHDQLQTILSTDTCSWRWILQFLETDRDALHDTDFIEIKSWLHVEGINNTDSLIIW